MNTKITMPSSITELCFDVADKTPREVVDELMLIASTFNYIVENQNIPSNPFLKEIVDICFPREIPFPQVSLKHKEWGSDGEEYDYSTNSLILGIISNPAKDLSIMSVRKELVRDIESGITFGEMCRKHANELEKEVEEDE